MTTPANLFLVICRQKNSSSNLSFNSNYTTALPKPLSETSSLNVDPELSKSPLHNASPLAP